MAFDHVANIMLKFQEAEANNIDRKVAIYFEQTFKVNFKKLEKQISTNWRLHKGFIET